MDQCKQIDFEYDIGMFTKNLATEELLCLQLWNLTLRRYQSYLFNDTSYCNKPVTSPLSLS